jgi:proline iminopeptidase
MANTNYWNLSTGSKIGYILIDAKGSKKSYPIVYLQGGPGAAITEKTIRMLIPFSEEGYDIYAYDQIGSGSSERLENIEEYTAERHTSDLEEIIKKIAADKVILIGQSWGSVLATFFAIDNPNKVEKIIMTGPGPVFPINKSLAALRPPDSLNIKAPIYSNQNGNKEVYTFRDKCIQSYAYILGNKLVPDKEVDPFFTHLNNSLNKSTLRDTSLVKESSGGGGYYAHIMTLKSLHHIEDPRKKMRQLNMNILILKGQYDNQRWGFTHEYVDLCNNATLKIIPNAGHFIDIEQPEAYYKAIKAFLENKNKR